MKRKYERITKEERSMAEVMLCYGGGFCYEIYARRIFGGTTPGEKARIARVAKSIGRGVMQWRRGESREAKLFLAGHRRATRRSA